jgi:dTDP-4-dehydrorhamnose 3,5-epimerase
MKKKYNQLKIIKKKKNKDFRGSFFESYNEKKYYKLYNIKFVQDNFSVSKKNVLRGFHGDNGTWKLISCISGKIQIAFINKSKKTKVYKKNKILILNEDDNLQILVPPLFGIAYLVLSNKAIVHYKQSSYYKQYKQFTINYKKKGLDFKWKSKKIITSKRDKKDRF